MNAASAATRGRRMWSRPKRAGSAEHSVLKDAPLTLGSRARAREPATHKYNQRSVPPSRRFSGGKI